MHRFTFLLGIILLSYSISNAQGLSLKGILRDTVEKTPLQGASVRLTAQLDSTIFFNTTTDRSGQFEFNNLIPRNYILSVTSVGYEKSSMPVSLADSGKDLGIVAITRQAKVLSAVTVTVALPPVRQKTDTLEYNASAFKVNPDANAEDMVKKMPGVTVDKGTVTAQGEQVRKVTIDGREFFGDDATAALRNLPAEVIDKIQVFDRLSDQAQFTGFDDGNSNKAINIVTKASMRNGQFGRLYAGYGTDDRYTAGGNATFFKGNRRISLVGLSNNINQQNFATQDLLGVTSSQNRGGGGNNRGGGGNPRGGGGGGNPGGGGGNFGNSGNFTVGQQPGISKTNALGINFSDVWGKKLELTGSYFFNNNNNVNNEVSTREYFGEPKQFYQENSFTGSKNYNHRLNMRIEYKIDSSNSLIITPNISFQNNKGLSTVEGLNYFSNGDTTSLLNSNYASATDGFNISNNILWRHAFAKRGRTFSVNLNTSFNNRDGEIYQESIDRNFKAAVSDTLQQLQDQLTKGYQLSANLVYTEPIGKKGQLQLNYNPSYSNSKADQQTLQYDVSDGKYSIFDTALSNKFDNTYTTQNVGVTYRIGDRDNQFSAGLNYQHSLLASEQTFPQSGTLDRTFRNLLPNIMLRRKLSPMSNIRVFYRSRTNAPSVNQLQNVINNTNPLFPSTGNPGLNQDYSHSLVGRYSYTNSAKRTSFFANVFVQNTQDYITNASYLLTSDSVISTTVTLREGARLSKPVNLDGYWNVRSFISYGLPLNFMKSNLNLNTGLSYVRAPGFVENQNTVSRTYTYNAGAVISSNVSEFVDFTLSYSANFNQVRNTFSPEENDKYFNHNASLQMNLLTKNGWFFQNELNNQLYRGLANGFNQDYWLWNMAIGKKFLKEQKGELKLSVFDLLKQNQAINRTTTESYIEDVQNDVLRQYFMLTFSYKLRNFSGRK